MLLFVEVSRGRTLSCHVDPSCSVEQLQGIVEGKEGIPCCAQRLIHAGKQLEGGRFLSDYGIQSEATVRVMLRIFGGMKGNIGGKAQAGLLTFLVNDIADPMLRNQEMSEQVWREEYKENKAREKAKNRAQKDHDDKIIMEDQIVAKELHKLDQLHASELLTVEELKRGKRIVLDSFELVSYDTVHPLIDAPFVAASTKKRFKLTLAKKIEQLAGLVKNGSLTMEEFGHTKERVLGLTKERKPAATSTGSLSSPTASSPVPQWANVNAGDESEHEFKIALEHSVEHLSKDNDEALLKGTSKM